MSFLKKLFGGSGSGSSGGGNDNNSGKAAEALEHEGYMITPAAAKEGGQYRLCGTISREIEGEVKTHKLIRADLFTSLDECNQACIRKAKQVISEQGDGIFR